MAASFTVDIADRIAHVRLCRPEKANALSPDFWTDFPAEIDTISAEARARVIVISSEGKHFTAGMDIAVFMQNALHADADHREVAAEAFRHTILALQRTFSSLERARQPVLAAVQGGAIGAGVDLATACDCRYASAEAFFCVAETAIGMTADVGTFPRLAKIIPEGWARQLAYTAERLPAAKAKEIGLVNEVFETPAMLLAGVMEIAGRIAAHSPLAVTGCKAAINHARDHSTASSLDYIAVWNAAMLSAADIKESYIAKSEGRAPAFADLKSLTAPLRTA
jgi:enoyl-CoA hydratase